MGEGAGPWEQVTLLRPQPSDLGSRAAATRGIPPELLSQAARRLSVSAMSYAAAYFFADPFPSLLVPSERATLFGRALHWVPPFLAIATGLAVAALARSPRLPLPTIMNIGLGFEVVGSYLIAVAEFGSLAGRELSGRMLVGLSWVAVWTLIFTIVVPTPPRRAVAAALASVSAVPVTVAVLIATGVVSSAISTVQFILGLVTPYLIVVALASVGSHVVYRLGTELGRARDLGSYHLEAKLGEGGMGEVWRARHRMLARPAAIKLIRPSLTRDARPGSADSALRRFEREAQAIARLRSPHTVELFDFGVAADGTFYYVMELLEGFDAEGLVEQFGPVPAGRAIHLLRQVCHSLSEAGSQGLVHRDIKPANIFLCRYGEEYDFVKVLDFGIVRGLQDGADSGLALTGENAVQGTPGFIAPEQAMGRPLDARADIYSTGCVAYWLLTGKLVFTGSTAMELLVQHARTPPTPPSQRTDRKIPADLEDLIMSCLAKDPAERPQSAREFSRRLAGVKDADDWTQALARDWWTRYQSPGRAPTP
ncbi:MAG: serine/threonine-protein kinase [Gemmatimonadales bacterium]